MATMKVEPLSNNRILLYEHLTRVMIEMRDLLETNVLLESGDAD